MSQLRVLPQDWFYSGLKTSEMVTFSLINHNLEYPGHLRVAKSYCVGPHLIAGDQELGSTVVGQLPP